MAALAEISPCADGSAPAAAELTEEEREVAQLLFKLPKLIVDFDQRRRPGIVLGLPQFLRWGRRKRRTFPDDGSGSRQSAPPKPPQPVPPEKEQEERGGDIKTSSPGTPFMFPASGCDEENDRRPGKPPKKNKDHKEWVEEQNRTIAALVDAKANLQRAIEEQKQLVQSLTMNSSLLREAKQVHQVRSREATMAPADDASQRIGLTSTPVEPACFIYQTPLEFPVNHHHQEQSGDGQRRSSKDNASPGTALRQSPQPAAARRGFLLDLNVLPEEMAEVESPPARAAASPLRQLPPAPPPPPQPQLQPVQQSTLPPSPQPPPLQQSTSLPPPRQPQPQPQPQPAQKLPVPPPPPPTMPSEWNHHHYQQQQLRQDKAAKTAESRKRRREIQREKRASTAAAAPLLHKLPRLR